MATINNNRKDRGKNKKRGNVIETPIDKRGAIASELGITEKTKKFYDEVIDNPRMGQVEAYKNTHDTTHHTNPNSADVAASRLLKSDKYAIYKASVVGRAKRRIASLVNSDNENIALKASQDIIDRTEGKATQKNEVTSRTVHVSLDVTGVKLGGHNISPSQLEELTS